MTARNTGSRCRRKIVIIEDHDETRLLYGLHFEGAGYVVEVAENGDDGIDAALRMQPDVIVLDLTMPRRDGWETIAILRAYQTTARTPVIACSAVDNASALSLAVALGCNAIVRKPCVPLDVERRINDLLGDPPESDTG